MKQMKMMHKVLLLSLCLLLIVCALAACGKDKDGIDSTWDSSMNDAPTYFKHLLSQSPEAREKFTAAYRGYNMSAPDFDDNALVVDPACEQYTDERGVVYHVSIAGAKAALELVKPEASDTTSTLKFNEFRDNLKPEHVVDTVEKLSTKVELENKSNPMVWVGKFLGLLTNITGGNYVFALFFFALIVEVLLLYFSIRQQKDSIKRAKLSPRERAIRKKYAGRNDQKSQQALQQEIQQMYQDEGASPFSGCLPLLIQMPIVIMLYRIVIDPLQYVMGKGEGLTNALTTYATTARAAGGLGQVITSGEKSSIELLSKLSAEALENFKNFVYFSNAQECATDLAGVINNLPNFNLFGINMGLIPSMDNIRLIPWLVLIPILTFVVYFVSMKLNRKLTNQPVAQDPQMGCSNNMMDITMPVMSVFITFVTPAAIGVYWIFKCLIGMLKQFILSKAMPLPVFTEEDYKRAEKELKGKARAADAVVEKPRGPVRSLHHIDDEEEALPPRKPEGGDEADYIPAEQRRKMEAEAKKEAASKQEKEKITDAAPLKEDRKSKKKK